MEVIAFPTVSFQPCNRISCCRLHNHVSASVQTCCRLYRDSTLYKDGKHVRDLSKLNRDLGKVLLVACDPDAYHLQPENTIKVRSDNVR